MWDLLVSGRTLRLALRIKRAAGPEQGPAAGRESQGRRMGKEELAGIRQEPDGGEW